MILIVPCARILQPTSYILHTVLVNRMPKMHINTIWMRSQCSNVTAQPTTKKIGEKSTEIIITNDQTRNVYTKRNSTVY